MKNGKPGSLVLRTKSDLKKLISGATPIGVDPAPPILMVRLKIYRCKRESHNPADWEICDRAMIPDWLSKNEEFMGHLLGGSICHDPMQDIYWYRAEQVDAPRVGAIH